MLRTPTILESEQLRLRDRTINGMLRPSILLGNASPGPLRESPSEALHSACMATMISGPRYGSTVGTSLVISANSSVWTTRPSFAYEGQDTSPVGLFRGREKQNAHIQSKPHKNPDKFFSWWEYFLKLRVMPTEHDNATLGAVRKQCRASPALPAFCPGLQITGKRSGHDTVNSPAPGHSSQGHLHCL
jgi:hypothetical protein